MPAALIHHVFEIGIALGVPEISQALRTWLVRSVVRLPQQALFACIILA
jgi:hypothetical protein